MIHASLLTKNSRDEHLNVFWQYDGRPWLENNITKALINTLENLTINEKVDFLKEICHIDFSLSSLSFDFYLQTSPDEVIIKSFDPENRMLFAFSPTGKSWGSEGIDINDEAIIRQSIEKSIYDTFPNLTDKEVSNHVEKEYQKVIGKIDAKGNSIPDGWILIRAENKPLYCIALENKLYDLDPFQLNNHRKKSLFLEKNQIIYGKYSDIVEKLSEYNNFLADEFIRYMFLLHYINIESLEQLSGIEGDLLDYYAKQHRISILQPLADSKGVETRKGWLPFIQTGKELCPLAGLDFVVSNKSFVLKLYIASKQSTAEIFYKKIASGYSIPEKAELFPSFHFNNGLKNLGGKNSNTYCCDNAPCNIQKYISFWIDNANLLHQMGPEERHTVLEKMHVAGIVNETIYGSTLQYSDSRTTKWNIVPEIGVYYTWSFEEALDLEKRNLLTLSIQEAISNTFNCFNI